MLSNLRNEETKIRKIVRFLVFGGMACFLISVLMLGAGCLGAVGGTIGGETGTAETGDALINIGMAAMLLSILAVFVGVIAALFGKAFGAYD